MKKLFSLCVALAFTLILAACSGGGAPAGAYDPDATAQALLDSGAFSEALEALDADLISSLYGLESQPEAAAVYTSTGATAEEIAVLVFSTQEEADDARKALEARVSDQKDACEGYLPAELPKLEQAIVKESGSSVLLVVANDSQAAQAALDGLGLDGSHRLIIVLMQLVNLLQDGQPVRMSKRSGKAIALRDLLDEVSVDAARFFFNSRSSTSALDFDLDLAVREDSENPVYYVQYAHARICSLIARLAEEGHLVPDAAAVDPALYATAEEKALIKTLSQLPEVIRLAARDYDPSGVNRYLVTLAGEFHRFYNACRIKGEEAAVLAARLKLADTVRAVIANCLSLIGVAAPEKM